MGPQATIMVLRLPRMEHSGEESGEHITAAKGTMLPEMIDNRVQVNPAVGFCCIPLSLIQFISVSPMTKPIESSARMEGNACAVYPDIRPWPTCVHAAVSVANN